MTRFVERARLGRALRALRGDPPGLLTTERAKALYAAGELTEEELERSADLALRREQVREDGQWRPRA